MVLAFLTFRAKKTSLYGIQKPKLSRNAQALSSFNSQSLHCNLERTSSATPPHVNVQKLKCATCAKQIIPDHTKCVHIVSKSGYITHFLSRQSMLSTLITYKQNVLNTLCFYIDILYSLLLNNYCMSLPLSCMKLMVVFQIAPCHAIVIL